ncbi:hypothetical protein FK178_11835 [Antarcticibacterium arcticum]|uniref:Uncharacterized protein n=1 Tax=Antarcticibacterium arcticum TaxID=2585771 RepID=A0A5B8YKG2_9FLAO|nr:hypothetical protein [Antarcticibacterium arcticum]QED38362.1 hypothetical protein FK178_11835 [Antarcticibacterium arcticum]
MFPLLLLAFFNAFSGVALSYPTSSIDLSSRDYDYLQEDQNRQGFIFQEFQINSPLQDTVKNNFTGAGLFEFSTGVAQQYDETGAFSSDYLQDRRSALKHQIFPFHFFW